MWVGFEMRMGRGGQEGGYLYSMAGQKDQKRSMVLQGSSRQSDSLELKVMKMANIFDSKVKVGPELSKIVGFWGPSRARRP